ncbi:hypothetical protein AAA799O18_00747, partial [Marine Group I thaumarchaeote SCGC AAA799-O18]
MLVTRVMFFVTTDGFLVNTIYA